MASSTSTPTAAGSAPESPDEPFEALLARLEQTVQRLERGELPLEDSLRAYEEGIGLVRRAQGRLDSMDKRLEQLLGDGRLAPLTLPEGTGERG
jgi:exodeoxyribonuclease VII small subunit